MFTAPLGGRMQCYLLPSPKLVRKLDTYEKFFWKE